MMRIAVFHAETGQIKTVYGFGDNQADEALLNIPEGYLAREVDDDFHPNEFYVDVWNEDALIPIPERPSEEYDWSPEQKEWRKRTPVELDQELNKARALTQIDKSDLLIRLAMAGILTPEEAEEAAGGTIPASMLPMLATLPPEAQMAAKIKWKADVMISRTHPVIVVAAYALGVTDTELDTIFGIPKGEG